MISEHYDSFKTVKEIFPNRFPGHRLTVENSLDGYMPTESGVIKKGQFFNQIGFTMKPGWKLVGWADPPVSGTDEHAIVFEKESPGKEGTYFETLDPGFYWVHGNAATLKFFVR